MITLRELAERLKREDPDYLIELLKIRSDDLIERFFDLVEEQYEVLVEEYEAEQAEFDPWGEGTDSWASDEETLDNEDS